MPGINTLNPIANQTPVTLSGAKYSIDRSGQSLSTGLNADNDVVLLSLGKSLSDNVSVYNSISSNLPYGVNLLNTGYAGLDSMIKECNRALNVTVQASTPDQNDIANLNNVLQTSLAQISRLTENTEFNGRKILNGDLYSDPSVKPEFKRLGVNAVVDVAALPVNSFLTTQSSFASTTVDCTGVAAGDAITITRDNVAINFTAVAPGTVVQEGQFVAVNGDDSATAANLASAIANHSSEVLQDLEVTVDTPGQPNRVVISQKSAAVRVVNDFTVADNTGGARLAVANGAPGATSALNMTNIKTLDDFIGAATGVNFTLGRVELSTAGNVNLAGNLATEVDPIEYPAPVGAANDSAAEFFCTVGDKIFTGVIYRPATIPGGNIATLGGSRLIMNHRESGESFVINFAPINPNQVYNNFIAQAVVNSLNNLFSLTHFYQTKTLKIDTSDGDIIRNNTPIASLKGLKASLKTDNFTDKEIDNFTITSGDGGNVRLAVTISGEDYVANVPAADIPNLVKGYKLNFVKDGDANSIFAFNLGEYGLTSLDNFVNYPPIASAFKKALQRGEPLILRTGESSDDTLKITVPDLSAKEIFVDNDGLYHENLSLLTKDDRNQAEEVLGNVLQKLRSTQSLIKSQTENVQFSINTAKNATKLTQDSADSYLRTGLVKSASAFSAAVKEILAAISTLGAGAKVADAAQKIIEQASV